MSNSSAIFKTLSDIDISSMVRQKGQYWYLPWANAVREVVKNYPSMTWSFTDYDGLPFLETKLGFFVECSVIIDGLCRKQMMPVLDFKNKTNMEPMANDINKCQMRALAKAISLHGLGLDLWAGEDLIGWGEDGVTEVEAQTKEQVLASEKEVSDWLNDQISNFKSIPNESAVKTVANRIKDNLRAKLVDQSFNKKQFTDRLKSSVSNRINELNQHNK